MDLSSMVEGVERVVPAAVVVLKNVVVQGLLARVKDLGKDGGVKALEMAVR